MLLKKWAKDEFHLHKYMTHILKTVSLCILYLSRMVSPHLVLFKTILVTSQAHSESLGWH